MKPTALILAGLLTTGSTLPAVAQDAKAPAATTPATDLPQALKDPQAQVSYAIGLNIGSSLRRDAISVDPQILIQGVKDAMSGEKVQMTAEQVQAVMAQLQANLQARRMEKAKQIGEANKAQGAAFLKANAAKPGVVSLASGLQYQILTAGTGPKPKPEDRVVCNYRGTLLDGTEFDSSYKRGTPATFPVTGVIRGWTEALQLMPAGSKWRLFVPSDLAYGENGAGADIGPNATLIFDVELIEVDSAR